MVVIHKLCILVQHKILFKYCSRPKASLNGHNLVSDNDTLLALEIQINCTSLM